MFNNTQIMLLLFAFAMQLPTARTFHMLTSMQETISPNAVMAICSLVEEYYEPRTSDVMISINVKDNSTAQEIDDFLMHFLPSLVSIKVNIEYYRGEQYSGYYRKYNLIIIDGLVALHELNPLEHTKDYDINEFYILYLKLPKAFQAAATFFIGDIFEYFWEAYIINVSILYESYPNVIEVYTYFPFMNASRCKTVSVESINMFSGFWHKSLREHIFPLKLLNLHNCPLNVAVYDTPPYLSYHPDKTGYEMITDFEAEMLIEISRKLNCSLQFVVSPADELRGKIYPNGTATGAMRLLIERKADLSLGSFRYTSGRCEVLTGALPYYQSWQVYGVLLTSQPYTPLEILSFAFDSITWLCLFLSLQITMAIAYLIYKNRKKYTIAEIMLGTKKATTPLTNILATFLGMPLIRQPKTNFVRFVIVLWFIYGIVMRAAYQSLLYQLLQTNLYRDPPKTLNDLITKGYKLVMTDGTHDATGDVPQIKAGIIDVILIHNISESSSFVYIEHSNEILLAGVTPKDFLTHYIISERKRNMFYVLPENIFAQHITTYFTKHSFLIDRFNALFMNLRSHGLINYWAAKLLDVSLYRRKSVPDGGAIDYEDISGVFLIYLVLIGAACILFGLEVMQKRFGVPKISNLNFAQIACQLYKLATKIIRTQQ